MSIPKMRIVTCCAVAALALGLAAPAAFAAAPAPKSMPGRITRKDGTVIVGNIRWMVQGKNYTVSQTRGDGQAISTDVALADVARVETKKPDSLDGLVRAVQSGKAAAAIPGLARIVDQYAMLGWDEPAAKWLAKAKIDTGDAAGAVKVCEDITATRPEMAYLGEVAPVYWQALLKVDKKAKLGDFLGKAISADDRGASAAALVMRGDMLMEQKDPRAALKDGYLRVVVLYESVRDVHPEALFKAAKAFDALSQNGNAEKLRTLLRTKYPRNEYAKML